MAYVGTYIRMYMHTSTAYVPRLDIDICILPSDQQSFCHALSVELSEHYCLVASLEAQQPLAEGVCGDLSISLSLHRLMVWTYGPLQVMKLLAILADNSKGVCVCVCVCVCACAHACVHACVGVFVPVGVRVRVYVRVCVRARVCVYLCVHMHTFVFVYLQYLRTYVHVYVSVWRVYLC